MRDRTALATQMWVLTGKSLAITPRTCGPETDPCYKCTPMKDVKHGNVETNNESFHSSVNPDFIALTVTHLQHTV